MARLGDKLIAGLPPKAVRDLLRDCWGDPFRIEDAAEHLHVSPAAAAKVVKGLLSAGVLKRARGARYAGRFTETAAGARLRCATALHRMKRETADRLLSELVCRAREANERSEYLHYVAEIHVYGSYLSPRVARLGDLDVAWKSALRPGHVADDVSWYVRTYLARGDPLERFVRGRSAYVSFHSLALVRGLPIRTKRVFAARSSDIARFRRPGE